ncbi:hypothetical protein ACKWRH_23530 [Bradyrhizobium sp. Pa8]|uniref:hypothetical protein n=1 Tax=Bradyrhizobium sp. Pa8 TaxID=3386552 RepID=UPI00403F5E5C
MILLATVLHLILLHGPDGHEVSVNPMTVTTVQDARADSDTNKQTTKGVACIISMIDGKFIAVREDCDTARSILQAR